MIIRQDRLGMEKERGNDKSWSGGRPRRGGGPDPPSAAPPQHGKLARSGGSSSAGRASVCGTECRGFKPRLPPQLPFISHRTRLRPSTASHWLYHFSNGHTDEGEGRLRSGASLH